ncbi:MAG: SURF1 family protein [Pseudotabrizicola sp.]|uniref:SURF1 family protein n=1 Tax=Pseudotabrizicola sp. TaxID=2939647 RepID=UPI0027158F0D|nr:SURF1 family protein [Pseudotabrizicola sp.]MDO9637922.1 SURF1 family protein [Pseudotabrizicola sp.]
MTTQAPRRMIIPLLFGLIGAAVLIGLGLWQLDRLAWKEAVLADIAARIVADPVALPAAPDLEGDRYLPVTASGSFTGESLDVLVSRREIGAGVRVIGVFESGDRRVLVDRGFVREGDRAAARGADATTVTGNLHWPDEVDSFTPPPDATTGLWFARDVPAMAAALKTERLLIVARAPTAPGIEPMPVDISGIPNNHLGYAVQWFGLAVVWLGMTAYLLWRIRRRTV